MIHCSESQLYWCEECKIPLYEPVCGCCGAKGRQFVKDVRVVFPEEKVLLEILLGLKAGELNEKSLWNAAEMYIISTESACHCPFSGYGKWTPGRSGKHMMKTGKIWMTPFSNR